MAMTVEDYRESGSAIVQSQKIRSGTCLLEADQQLAQFEHGIFSAKYDFHSPICSRSEHITQTL